MATLPSLPRYPDESMQSTITTASRWGVWLTSLQRLLNAAAHVSGQATFAGAGTRVVTLDTGQPDTAYRVQATPNVGETIWVTLKTTAGFTLNSSNGASVAVVDWILTR